MIDPILGQAGQGDPTMHAQAPVALTPPLPATKAAEIKYYHCPVMNASMHRADGKKIAFVNGICETDVLHDQQYLQNEIDSGSQYIRVATAQEVETFKMQKDPKGTMKQIVAKEIEDELRIKIEAELRAKMGLPPSEMPVNDELKLAGSDIRSRINASNRETVQTSGATVLLQNQAASQLKPVSTADLAGATVQSGK
jgi:hypothetical protein